MPIRRLGLSAREAVEVPRDLLLRRYPPFVTGGPLPRGDIPVFVFHSLEPESFARKLSHLAENGYRTLSADEYLAVLEGRRPAPERAVVLTFDDGRGSVWTVGGPLLERFGMKGIVFLVPGRLRARPPSPTWTDVEAGRAERASVLAREAGDGALLSWDEVEALSRRDLVDFQSHTLTHARVHVGPRVVGFATPASRHGYHAFDQPLVREGEVDLLGAEVPLGTPLFHSAPRLSEQPRFFEDASVRRDCVDLVASEREAFFLRADWETQLRRVLRGRHVGGRPEGSQERQEAIRRELALARRLIEERTGRTVTHLCYPWHAAGPTAQRLAREAGYLTVFAGKVKGVPITRPGGELRTIARIGEDWLELLPGRGRASLAEILRRKWARRFGAGA